jgi:release factor glutamine methyltransferase
VTTVAGLLRAATERLRASGSPSPRLDAELLLGHVLGVERTTILAHPETPVGPDHERRYDADVDRRATGEPVAYIRGIKEFYGLAFAADRRALIPRPETERLVELAEEAVMRRLVRAPRVPGAPRLWIADVGTGSGAVAIALVVSLKRRGVGDEFSVMATELSEDALQLARENAVGHAAADRIRVVDADLLPGYLEAPFDLVLANLPYVRSDVIPGLPVATSFEPRLALDGGPDGLDVVRRLLARLADGGLATDGEALLEIGADQGEAIVETVAAELPGWRCTVERDLAGLPRVARIVPPAVAVAADRAAAAADRESGR